MYVSVLKLKISSLFKNQTNFFKCKIKLILSLLEKTVLQILLLAYINFVVQYNETLNKIINEKAEKYLEPNLLIAIRAVAVLLQAI